MSDETLGFCDLCFTDLGSKGTMVCSGVDAEFNAPLVDMYHVECYAKVTNKPHCTDCVDNPCFIKRKSMK